MRGSIPSRQCTEVFGTRLNVSQMSWVVHFSSHQKGNFCPSCGNILEIPGVSDDVVCNVCGYSCLVDGLYLQVFVRVTCTDLNIKEIVTKSRAFSKQNKRTATKTEDHGATVSFFWVGNANLWRCKKNALPAATWKCTSKLHNSAPLMKDKPYSMSALNAGNLSLFNVC